MPEAERLQDLMRMETVRAAYGIDHCAQGFYGCIALRVRDRIAERSGSHQYAYVLWGVHNKTGRFPGNDEWKEAIARIPGASWGAKHGRWTIPLPDKHSAEEINRALYPVLSEAMRARRAALRERTARYHELRRFSAQEPAHPSEEPIARAQRAE